MSFTDRLILWLHVAFVVFTIGPVTIAMLASPRHIRRRNVAVLRYLRRTTGIFGTASLGVLIFGVVAAQQLRDLSKAWVSVAITLFVVALVLLVLIMRDQGRAINALESAAEDEALVAAGSTPPPGEAPEAKAETPPPAGTGEALHTAALERGRIASMAGIVSLIWLAILVMMVWNS